MAGDSAFISALVINSAVAIVFITAYCLLRRKLPRIYNPRALLHPDLNLRVSSSLLGWIRDAWRISDDEFYRVAGLDALIYACMYRFGIQLFCVCSLYGLIVLVPINYSAQGDSFCDTTDDSGVNSSSTLCSSSSLTGLDSISLSNVPAEDTRLWAHLISAYIFVGAAIYFLGKFYAIFIKYRLRYFGEGRMHCHTIFIRDIPEAYARQEALLQHMREVFGPDVLEAHLVLNTGQLKEFVNARDQAVQKLERVLAIQEAQAASSKSYKHKKPPQTRIGGYILCGGELVNSERHLKEKISNLNASIKTRQRLTLASPTYHNTGFVTFRTVGAAALATQSLFSSQPFAWNVKGAPEARDIHWSNCIMPHFQRYVRHWLLNTATFFMVFFWAIPVAFVASLTTLQELSDRLPFLDPVINSNEAVKGFLEGFLPTLVLVIFMAVLPTILTAISSLQGIPAMSWIKLSMMRKFYYFQVVNVFFVSLIAGSAFTALSDIISSPTSIISLLGTSIPKTGYFFTNYVMLQAFSHHTGMLLRIGNLIIYKLKYKFLAKSKREKEAAWSPNMLDYGQYIPMDLLVVLIGMTYATVAPLVLPFATLYFAIGYIIYRNNMVHVYEPTYETGGLYFPRIFNRIMAGIVIYEVTLVGIFGLKKVLAQTLLMIPLIIYTFHAWSAKNSIYLRIGSFISQEEAMQVKAEFVHAENEFRVPELNANPDEGAELINSVTSVLCSDSDAKAVDGIESEV